MKKAFTGQKAYIVIVVLLTCILCSSCRYMIPGNKQVITDIAVIVTENYSSGDVETPYYISMNEIDELADNDSYLHKAIEKYHDVQHYHVYLIENNKVLIVTDSFFQAVKGYVVSDEELKGTIKFQGLGFDNSSITILEKVGDSNLYSFSAGN